MFKRLKTFIRYKFRKEADCIHRYSYCNWLGTAKVDPKTGRIQLLRDAVCTKCGHVDNIWWDTIVNYAEADDEFMAMLTFVQEVKE